MKVGGNRSAGGGRKDGGGRKGGGRKEGRETGCRFLNNIYIILFRSHSIFIYFYEDFYVDKCNDFHFAAGQSIQEENQRCHRDGGLMGSTLRAFFFVF